MAIPIHSYTTQENSLLLKIIILLFVTNRIIFMMTRGQWPTGGHFNHLDAAAQNGQRCNDLRVSDPLAAVSASLPPRPAMDAAAMTHGSVTRRQPFRPACCCCLKRPLLRWPAGQRPASVLSTPRANPPPEMTSIPQTQLSRHKSRPPSFDVAMNVLNFKLNIDVFFLIS